MEEINSLVSCSKITTFVRFVLYKVLFTLMIGVLFKGVSVDAKDSIIKDDYGMPIEKALEIKVRFFMDGLFSA